VPSFAHSVLEAALATRRRLGRTTIVGISGIDCAGKSTLARQVAAHLATSAVVIVGDDFNRPRSESSPYPSEESDYGFDYRQLIRELLVPAQAGGRVETRLRVKDWQHNCWDERDFVVGPGAIVIVEGVFLFRPEVVPLLDLKIWLEVSFEDALARALARDAEAMGGEDGVRERYATRYFPAQRLHLERERPREHADLVVRSSPT
jgi:uridine kinase